VGGQEEPASGKKPAERSPRWRPAPAVPDRQFHRKIKARRFVARFRKSTYRQRAGLNNRSAKTRLFQVQKIRRFVLQREYTLPTG